MGNAPLITEQHTPLKPHVRCNPPLAVRKLIRFPDGRTCVADEPYWHALDAMRRLNKLDDLYEARGYTLERQGKVTYAVSAANTVRYYVEWL